MTVIKPGTRLRGTCHKCGCTVECLPKEAEKFTKQWEVFDPIHAFPIKKTAEVLGVRCPECDPRSDHGIIVSRITDPETAHRTAINADYEI